MMSEEKANLPVLMEKPEDLIFSSCYAPFDLSSYLQSAETRSKIRRLPATQLYFSLRDLDQEDMALLLPQLTEEQWAAFLDLDLWEKDELNPNALLHWESFTLEAEDPVARKLLRATDPELLQLLWQKELQIYPRVEEDEFEGEPPDDRNTFITPDNNYLVALPEDPEKSRILYAFIQHLYHLDPEYASLSLENSRWDTGVGLEETAYQNRCRRTEAYGFQDYFDALEIYTPRSPEAPLPEKDPGRDLDPSDLPIPVNFKQDSRFIFIEALSSLSLQGEISTLLQEMFFVCNKIISADRSFAGDPENIKDGISKALNGINLGLDLWAGGDLSKASEGLTRHFLSSFFQVGYDAILKAGKAASRATAQEPGSFGEAVLEALKDPYPRYTESEEKDGKISFSSRYFKTAAEIRETMGLLKGLIQE